jgi:hypothetical protein
VTTYQQVTRYRNVPYQTVSQIPQVSTQYVPRQRLSYLPPTASCDPCLSGTAYPQYGFAPSVAVPTAEPPAAGGVPEYPLTAPQADANAQWQTIPQRQAQQSDAVQQMGGFSNSYRRPVRRSAFQPAPSAATAWQSRWLR